MAKIMDVIGWGLFIDAVEGNPTPLSCALIDGEPAFTTERIPAGAKPDPQLLADFLRGPCEIPPQIRTWLANLIDPAGEQGMQLKLSQRKPGRRMVPLHSHWHAAKEAKDLIDAGMQVKGALGQVGKKYRLHDTTIENAMRHLEEAQEINAEISRDE